MKYLALSLIALTACEIQQDAKLSNGQIESKIENCIAGNNTLNFDSREIVDFDTGASVIGAYVDHNANPQNDLDDLLTKFDSFGITYRLAYGSEETAETPTDVDVVIFDYDNLHSNCSYNGQGPFGCPGNGERAFRFQGQSAFALILSDSMQNFNPALCNPFDSASPSITDMLNKQ